MLDINWNPSRRDLRQFGLVWLPLFAAVLGYAVLRRTGEWPIPMAIWGVATAVALIALVAFVWRELTTSDPIMDFTVFTNRNFALGTAFVATNQTKDFSKDLTWNFSCVVPLPGDTSSCMAKAALGANDSMC